MTSCDELETPPNSYAPAVFPDAENGRRIILTTPRGDERLYQGRVHQTFAFAQAIDRAEAGTTIRLLPGKYYRAVEAVGKRGSADQPIVIEGTRGPQGEFLTHICGTNAAGAIYPDLPDRDDYAFIRLRRCRHVVVRDLQVESCWPSFVYAERTSSLSVENIEGRDGTYLIFVRGPDARGIAVRGCRWTQDPTGTMWSAISWDHTHHGPYAYYNGALIGGIDVSGDLEVGGNVVRHAFNGIRFTTSRQAESDILGRYNVNARIHGNLFENIRDNAIEPERTLLNWHVFNNQMNNVHAAFSIHHFFGGYLYIYGNLLWFDDRAGADYQDNRGGKIYKLHRSGSLPKHPIHVFHNSLYSRTFLIKKARARNFVHRNNAVQFCAPADHEIRCLCRDDREFLREFPVDGDCNPIPWDSSVIFNGDASSKGFSEVLRRAGQEADGIAADDLGFAAPRNGNFQLAPNSELRNKGLVFTLKSGADLPQGQPDWSNWTGPGQPNIGAVQDDGQQMRLPFTRMPLP